MKMFTTIAVATAFLGLAACSKNEPATAPTEAVTAPAPAPAVDNASAPAAAPVDAAGGSAKPAEGAPVQPK